MQYEDILDNIDFNDLEININKIASFRLRFLASILDIFAFFIVGLLVIIILPDNGTLVTDLFQFVSIILSFVFIFLVPELTRIQGSFGKYYSDIRMVNAKSGKPDKRTLLLRFILKTIPFWMYILILISDKTEYYANIFRFLGLNTPLSGFSDQTATYIFIISLFYTIALIMSIIFNKKRQGFHDRLAGTFLIRKE